ncbi:MAG: hypothetical protein HY900_28810 [Deltaproteobacteria bacterium]|nr:hypothetical protein [Deltaproteobacteria bacterium]
MLEAISAPLARTWVFFSAGEARAFIRTADYPLVFKLRRGAGSMNVRLVEERKQAERLIRQMFGFGQRPYPVLERIQRGTARARVKDPGKDPFLERAGRAARFLLQQTFLTPRERGYVLFQRYVPGNDHDIRVTVIGERAFAFVRGVRPDDFRASGSGRISYLAPPDLPVDAIRTAFGISRALGFESMAYDFVRDPSTSAPVLLEISYSFQAKAVHDCPGYVDRSLRWHEGNFWPEDLIMDDLVTAGSSGVRCP